MALCSVHTSSHVLHLFGSKMQLARCSAAAETNLERNDGDGLSK